MEDGPDFISSLPHDVLLLIASMIPLKEAIRTAVLSNSWRNLWTPSQVLKLELGSSHDQARMKMKQVLGSFSMYYEYPEKLKLYLPSVNYFDKRADYTNLKDESFAIVTKGTQGEVHFDFSGGEKLNNSPKFNLILETGGLSYCPTFSSLKSLQLRSVTHVAENLVTDLFSCCQFLESLKLEKCRGLQNIDIKANNSLKSFTISDCFDINSIKVSAPSLKVFSYKGILPTVQLNHAPDLAEAVLNFKDGGDFNCEDVLNLLFSLKDVEMLTISGWLLEVCVYAWNFPDPYHLHIVQYI